MRDIIAILRTLVLPAGATTGQRIVLNGDTGRISVFDAANHEVIAIFPHQISVYNATGNELLRMDDVGFAVFNATGQLLARLSSAGNEFFSGQNDETLAGRVDALAVGAAAAVDRRSQLFLQSPRQNAKARATIAITSEAEDGSIKPQIALSVGSGGTINLDAPGGDVTGPGGSFPRGIVAVPKASAVATSVATTTELKDTQVGDYTLTAVAGRRYRVHYQCRLRSTVAADKVDVRIRDGGGSSPTNASTLLTGAEGTVSATTGGDDLKVEQTLLGLSAGTHIIAAFYVRALGTGNVNLDVATGQVRELYVEDIGGI